MRGWEKRFLRYCVQEKLLSARQAKRLSKKRVLLPPDDKRTIANLISSRLGWDEDLVRAHLSRALSARETVILDNLITNQDLSLQSACDLVAQQADGQEQTTASRKRAKERTSHLKNVQAMLERERGSRRIGAYRLVQKLAEHQGVTVHKVYHEMLKKYFVLKVFHPCAHQQQDLASLQAALRENVRLEHPNIVRLYDVVAEPQRLYIVMDYIAGQDLAQRLEVAGPLSGRQAMEMVLPLTAALQSAHQEAMLHGNIKPPNIILAAADQTPYWTDLGLARAREQAGWSRDHNSIPYLAPEQIAEQEVDARSDVYSLGAVLYTSLAGQPLFSGMAGQCLLRAIRVQEPLPLTVCCPQLARDVAAVVHKCLCKDPSQRYQDMGALHQDVERYLNGAQVQVRLPRSWERLALRLRQHWQKLSLLGVLLLVILVAGLGLYHQQRAQQAAHLLALAHQAEQRGAYQQAAGIYQRLLHQGLGPRAQVLAQQQAIVQARDRLLAQARAAACSHFVATLPLPANQQLVAGRLPAFLHKALQARRCSLSAQTRLVWLQAGLPFCSSRGISQLPDAWMLFDEQQLQLESAGQPQPLPRYVLLPGKAHGRLLRLGDPGQSWRQCSQLLRSYGPHGPTLQWQLQMQQVQRAWQKRARQYYEQGLQISLRPSLSPHQRQQALHLFMQAWACDPWFAPAYYQAGQMAARRGEIARAQHYYAYSVALEPDYSAPKYFLTLLRLSDQIISSFSSQTPVNVVYNRLEHIFRQLWPSAAAPHDPYALLARCQLVLCKLFLARRHPHTEAYQAWRQTCQRTCRQVIAQAPYLAAAYLVQAQLHAYPLVLSSQALCIPVVFHSQYDFSRAQQACAQVIALQPHNMAAYALRARLAESVGDYARAIEDYSQAIAGCPRAFLYHHRAICYLATQRYVSALADLDRSVALLATSLAPDQNVAPSQQIFLGHLYYRDLYYQALVAALLGKNVQARRYWHKCQGHWQGPGKQATKVLHALATLLLESPGPQAREPFARLLAAKARLARQARMKLTPLVVKQLTHCLQAAPDLFCAPPAIKQLRGQANYLARYLLRLRALSGAYHTPEHQVNLGEIALLLPKYRQFLASHPQRAFQNSNEEQMLPLDLLLACWRYLAFKTRLEHMHSLPVLPSAVLYYQRAISHYIDGNLKAARQDLSAALKLSPNSMQCHYGLSTIYAILSAIDPSDRPKAMSHLRKAMQSGWRHLEDYTRQDREFRTLRLPSALAQFPGQSQ